MISKNVLRGLCKICVNGRTCTFLNGQRRRVYQCDEFVPVTRVEKEVPWTYPVDADEDCPVAHAALLNGRRGLCRSCGRWQECAFPHAEGGVWHCEEYC